MLKQNHKSDVESIVRDLKLLKVSLTIISIVCVLILMFTLMLFPKVELIALVENKIILIFGFVFSFVVCKFVFLNKTNIKKQM